MLQTQTDLRGSYLSPQRNSRKLTRYMSPIQSRIRRQKEKGWSKKKKTGIVLGIIFVAFIIIIAIIVGLFFHYTGMLDRTKDTKINSGRAPINSSELTSEADTFDAKEKRTSLRLSYKSSPPRYPART